MVLLPPTRRRVILPTPCWRLSLLACWIGCRRPIWPTSARCPAVITRMFALPACARALPSGWARAGRVAAGSMCYVSGRVSAIRLSEGGSIAIDFASDGGSGRPLAFSS